MLAAIAAGPVPAMTPLAMKGSTAIQKRLKAPPSTLAGGIPANVL
jgi:hypothetical protein